MLKYILSFLAITPFSSAINQNLNGMATFFQHYFSGTNNLRVVSIILLLLAFILFIFLIVILYIRSLLSFIKESEATLSSRGAKFPAVMQDDELEKELDKEFERDMEASRIEREELRQQKKKDQKSSNKIEEDVKKVSESSIVTQKVSTTVRENGFRGNAHLKEFDWGTGRQGELDEVAAGIGPIQAKHHIESLINTTGLIINMLGRNIDAGKIAQTIKNICGDSVPEEEIIQAIDSIQNFISLANNGKFDMLPNRTMLPSAEEALMALSKGDTSLTLSLMETLINVLVDKGAQATLPQKRDIIFLEASNYACIFGSIAHIDEDVELATSAFELAIELSPKNANAWSRVADSYARAKTDSKAVWAYQNVLNYANTNMYPHQIANANKQLAEYYEAQGDMQKASVLHSLSNNYYNTIGINTPLTDKEFDIIRIIKSKQEENMPETIAKLLNISKQKQRAYG